MPETKQGPAPAAPAAEPLAAILAEMRECAHFNRKSLREMPDGYRTTAFWGDKPIVLREAVAERIDNFADRIEAAAARERKENEAKVGEMIAFVKREMAKHAAPGNAAAMRAALENTERVARFCAEAPWHTPGYPTDAARAAVLYSRIAELGRVACAALAAPARNCDVGTAEEQAERHERFCAAHYKADAVDAQCFGCPASDKKETDCEFVWGQLPFAPAEGGAE